MKSNFNFQKKAGRISRLQLETRSSSIAASAKRDQPSLIPYGVTDAVLTSLEEKREAYAKTNFVEQVMKNKTGLMAQRNQKADKVKEAIGLVRSQVAILEFETGREYSSVLHTKLAGIKIPELLILAEKTRNILADNQEELSAYGFTPESLQTFDTLVQEFKTLCQLNDKEGDYLNNYTADRRKAKAELYKLISFVSRVGRAYWLRKDKSRASDYTLYKQTAVPPDNSDDNVVITNS